MQTRLALWSIPVLSLILVLGCTPQPTPPPADTGDPSTTRDVAAADSTLEAERRFSNEVYVLVETDGDTLKVSPDPVIVHDRKQRVIWVADDDELLIEITFRPDKGKDSPGVEPPAKPCNGKANKCGENAIGGNVGKFYYSVIGTKGAKTIELDPVLEILY